MNYSRTCSYPSISTSKSYAFLNVFGFRKRNWRFDIAGGMLYFFLIFSLMPVCNLDIIFDADTWFQVLIRYWYAIFQAHVTMFESTYLSLLVFIGLWITLILFTECPWPFWKRLLVGTLHTLSHSVAALGVLILMVTTCYSHLFRAIFGISY